MSQVVRGLTPRLAGPYGAVASWQFAASLPWVETSERSGAASPQPPSSDA